MHNIECLFLFHTLMQLKNPEQRGMGGQVEIRNSIKIQISNDQNIFDSEAPPQTDELREKILHCLRRSDTGCWMLDKEKNIHYFIQYPEARIQHHVTAQ